ncbi:MAG: hypothetical protein ACI4RD_09250 [Kiritimatiellia bacterium]
MEMSEFLARDSAVSADEELTVQKAVVESLAADKVEQDERIRALQVENDRQKAVVEALTADKAEQGERIRALQAENDRLKGTVADLRQQLEALQLSLAKAGDRLAANAEGEYSNQVTLLERNHEIGDRFVGETRDHVLEVIQEARDAAEQAGRIRRAQLLESVIVANTPTGNLSKRREALQKLFSDNGNILSGPVISQLEQDGIAHKHGEDYLLPAEIIQRTY